MKEPERTNETTGIYAQQCVALAEELGLRCVNLWSKMQETNDWQKKYLRSVSKSDLNILLAFQKHSSPESFLLFSNGSCSLLLSSDGLHLTPEGNGVVFEELSRVFREAWLSPEEMPFDFPHHSQIDGQNPSKAFEERCL